MALASPHAPLCRDESEHKLPRSFYLRPTLTVAKELLGKFLCRRFRNKTLIGRIVEVEAYLGAKDPASHAYRGRTRRNDVMFWEGGHLYVYFTYGMHFCANVVTEREGKGMAVLLRAVEPVQGMEIMIRNRQLRESAGDKRILRNLCSGPARFCQAFAIARNENGTDLCGKEIWIARDMSAAGRDPIGASTRVGVRNGSKNRWRFYFKASPFVSPGKPASVRPEQA